jgi:Tfp pilus assembly protein PilO
MNREQMRQLFSEHRTQILAVISLLLLSSAVWIYQIWRQGGELSRLQAEWTEKRKQASLKAQRDPSQVFRKGGEDLNSLMVRIPARYEFPRVLGQLMDTASANQVTLGTISYKPQNSTVNGLIPYVIHFSASGTYAGVKRFLAATGQLDGMAFVESVALSNTDPFEDRVNMEMQLVIHLRDGGQP